MGDDTLLGDGQNNTDAGTDGSGDSSASGADNQAGANNNQDGGDAGNNQDGAGGSDNDGSGNDADDSSGQGAPENYEAFTLPEGMELDKSLVEGVTPIFKELGLDQGSAQKLVDAYNAAQTQRGEADNEAQADMVKGWNEELKADKDFGGDKFDENIATAKKAIKEFGSPELTDMMNSTGIGSHPEFVKFVFKIGSMMSEDSFRHSGDGAGGEKKGHAQILYGDGDKS